MGLFQEWLILAWMRVDHVITSDWITLYEDPTQQVFQYSFGMILYAFNSYKHLQSLKSVYSKIL